jgi:hypothetical protein
VSRSSPVLLIPDFVTPKGEWEKRGGRTEPVADPGGQSNHPLVELLAALAVALSVPLPLARQFLQ